MLQILGNLLTSLHIPHGKKCKTCKGKGEIDYSPPAFCHGGGFRVTRTVRKISCPEGCKKDN